MALLTGLALAGGGFGVADRHWAALAAWGVVIGLIAFGAGSATVTGRPLYWSVGALVSLALLSAISSSWSGSVERTVIETARVLGYLGFFLAAFLITRTRARRQRFAEGLTAGLALIVLLGLGSRLLPHVIEVTDISSIGPRLRYPLGYSNGDGAIFGFALVMLAWAGRRASWPWARWLAVGLMPATFLALYFTFSRGGLLAGVVGVIALLALSRDRLWHLCVYALAGLGALPAIIAVNGMTELENGLVSGDAIGQGVTVLLILLVGTACSVVFTMGLAQVFAGGSRPVTRLLAISRDRRVLRGIAGAAGLLAVLVAIVFGGRIWDKFSDPVIRFPSNPGAHFTEFYGAGRYEFYKVALDEFSEHPLAGTGAGTYKFDWQTERDIDEPVVEDAHSLYIEMLAELGVVGFALILAIVGGALWFGLGAWRAATDETDRSLYGALSAVMFAFAISACFDWFWEIADLAAVFFLAAGVLVSVRCQQLAPASTRPVEAPARSRYGIAISGLALGWISVVVLAGPVLVDRELGKSREAVIAAQEAAAGGDATSYANSIQAASNYAETARTVEPFAASPYVQLGLLAELQGQYDLADERLSAAIAREDRNWQLWYLRSRIRFEAGHVAAAQADLRRARALNPREDIGSPAVTTVPPDPSE